MSIKGKSKTHSLLATADAEEKIKVSAMMMMVTMDVLGMRPEQQNVLFQDVGLVSNGVSQPTVSTKIT